jgi:CubicO group peptidase (beta-lactamase class C family)
MTMRDGDDRTTVHGFAHPDFASVRAALRRQLEAYPGGAAVCVYHHGECVADLWGGHRDEAGTPWSRETMAPSFSTTKGVASTLVHILVDRRLLDYDEPVARYWPEFAQGGKDRITVRHVLAHQSGLYHVRRMIDRADRMLDWDHMVGAIERATPLHPPGACSGYHGLTYGFITGELVRRVTGKPFSEAVHDLIAAPLGLDGLYVGTPVDQLHRAARLIWPRGAAALGRDLMLRRVPQIGDWLRHPGALVARLIGFDVQSIFDALVPHGIDTLHFDAEATLRAAIPAANGVFTARALARMYAALARGGTLDGVRLLSLETLVRAIEPQPPARTRAVIPFDMRWRLGYHGVWTTRGIPRRGFGHYGFGGSGAWADPRRELSVALVVNSGMGTPFGDFRVARVSGAALAAAEAIRRRAPRVTSVPGTPPRIGSPAPAPR